MTRVFYQLGLGHLPQAAWRPRAFFAALGDGKPLFYASSTNSEVGLGSNHAWWFFKAHYLGAFEEWEPFWETYDPTCLSNFGVAHFQNTIFSYFFHSCDIYKSMLFSFFWGIGCDPQLHYEPMEIGQSGWAHSLTVRHMKPLDWMRHGSGHCGI